MIAVRRIGGRHVLLMVVAFFAVVSAVNAVMIWLALGSYPGLTSHNAYQEGLAYNHEIAARRAQESLGWAVAVDVASANGVGAITAQFRDRAGAPLTGLAVTAELLRPVAEGNDQTVTLAETAPGVYRAEVAVPLPGKWLLDVAARAADDVEWKMERELWLK